MNDFIGNNYGQNQDQLKTKKMMKLIGIILVLLFIVAIALVVLIYYIQSVQLKISINGQSNKTMKDIVLINNGQVYVPIREFAEYVGYESYSGDNKGEDITKCYVKNANEETSFTMNSDKIYKQLTDKKDYEYFTINEPVKMINETLYITKEGAEKAFNIKFSYDAEKNQITINTLPYLVTYWASRFENSAIMGKESSFSNQKALLYDMIVVKNQNNYYGVYDLKGKEILGTKYSSIEFIESNKEFIVTTAENKKGIMSHDATTKISPEYDEIKQIDKDTGLYLVTNNKKQGVVNSSGNIIIYIEYDQIGVNADNFSKKHIINQYLLYDNCIPVKQNNKWGIFDKNGGKILPVEYEDLGCKIGAGKQEPNANNILLIPEYQGIIVKNNNFYGIVDSNGKTLIPIALKTVYSVIASGEETFYMIYNEQKMNVIAYIQKYVKPENTNNNTNQNNTNNENNTNTVGNNQETNNVTNEQTANNQTVNDVQTNNQQTTNTVPTNANTVNQNNTTSNDTTAKNNVNTSN